MKRFSEQFNTKAKTIRLTAAERSALRERVVSYMEYHPLPQAAVPTPYVEVSPLAFLKTAAWKKFQYGGAVAAALVFVVSLVAEQAVPGDALYAVKQVNEEVRGGLAIGSYEKVVWETERLNRRIAEARILASEGRLTEEVEAKVAEAVKVHSENARKEIEVLKQTDEDEATMAAIELTTALEVQTTSLQNQDPVATSGATPNLIEEVVQDAVRAVEQSSGDNSLPSYEKLKAKTERETTRARELLLGINDSATAEEQTDIKRRLEDVDRKIVGAEGLKSTDEILAREGLVEVLEQTHRLIVFMTNIDVRATVTVEEIVPVTLTDAERIEVVKTQITEMEDKLVAVEEVLTGTSTLSIEDSVREKTLLAVEVATTTVSTVKEILSSEVVDPAIAEAAITEGYSLLNDVAAMLGIRDVDEAVEALPVIPSEEVVPDEVVSTTTEPEEVSTTTESAETEDLSVTESAE